MIGSLFSGIGGLELGLERAGLGPVAWQVEKDAFCRSVLAKHWPNVTRYTDVCEVGSAQLAPVDVLCGGFPCQDVSSAGARRGLSGERSGLWFEYLRIASELRPRVVVVENVASGKKLWLPAVRAGLEAIGYRVRAFALSAADVGAPHLRRRIFVVAHADGVAPGSATQQGGPACVPGTSADPDRIELRQQPGRGCGAHGAGEALARVDGQAGPSRDADRDGQSALSEHGEVAGVRGVAGNAPAWPPAPDLRRMDDGVPDRVDRARRLKSLGNAVVPSCAEAIGRMILDSTDKRSAGK